MKRGIICIQINHVTKGIAVFEKKCREGAEVTNGRTRKEISVKLYAEVK
jgi:hypothetical protein